MTFPKANLKWPHCPTDRVPVRPSVASAAPVPLGPARSRLKRLEPELVSICRRNSLWFGGDRGHWACPQSAREHQRLSCASSPGPLVRAHTGPRHVPAFADALPSGPRVSPRLRGTPGLSRCHPHLEMASSSSRPAFPPRPRPCSRASRGELHRSPVTLWSRDPLADCPGLSHHCCSRVAVSPPPTPTSCESFCPCF